MNRFRIIIHPLYDTGILYAKEAQDFLFTIPPLYQSTWEVGSELANFNVYMYEKHEVITSKYLAIYQDQRKPIMRIGFSARHFVADLEDFFPF